MIARQVISARRLTPCVDQSLIEALASVKNAEDLRFWVRCHLRRLMPHACFLATAGNLYGLGSLPTHRFTADFPLSMLEELKNSSGAIVDPLVIAWFKTGKLSLSDVEDVPHNGIDSVWCQVMRKYGMRNILLHGTLDHKRRRFVLVQLANVFATDRLSVAETFGSIVDDVSTAVFRVVVNSANNDSLKAFGDPTLCLTTTELHIVELLAQGLSNKEIARLRGVSDSTVKTQVQRTGAKLGATRRAEIVAIAMPFLRALPPQSVINYDGRS